jgi:hypothetical protein
MAESKNPYEGQGGSVIHHADGRFERLEEPTKDHELGNCARDRDGKPLDPQIRAREEAATAAVAAPKKKGGN